MHQHIAHGPIDVGRDPSGPAGRVVRFGTKDGTKDALGPSCTRFPLSNTDRAVWGGDSHSLTIEYLLTILTDLVSVWDSAALLGAWSGGKSDSTPLE